MSFRNWLIHNLGSPYGLTAVSFLVFLVAIFFPPGVYSSSLGEPDLIFLDSASFIFFLLCTLGFLLGVLLVEFIFPVNGFVYERKETRISPMLLILLPVIAGAATAVVSILLLLRDNTYLLTYLLSMRVAPLEGVETQGILGHTTAAVTGIVWWAIWRKGQLNIRGWQNSAVRLFIGLAIVALLVLNTLKLMRAQLVAFIAGVAVLLLLRKLIDGKLTTAFVLKFALFFALAIAAAFAQKSLLRGGDATRAMTSEVLGYTIASYNRLAAILDGRMHYPFAGRGFYISTLANSNHTFNRIFHANEVFAWPDAVEAWGSEFNAADAAGLNGNLIWAGAFGYIFSDLKWLSPFLLIAYGLLTGWAWRSLKLGKTLGILLYPWCGFCVLFWFGYNYLLDTQAIVLIIEAILLVAYESVFIHPSKSVRELN